MAGGGNVGLCVCCGGAVRNGFPSGGRLPVTQLPTAAPPACDAAQAGNLSLPHLAPSLVPTLQYSIPTTAWLFFVYSPGLGLVKFLYIFSTYSLYFMIFVR